MMPSELLYSQIRIPIGWFKILTAQDNNALHAHSSDFNNSFMQRVLRALSQLEINRSRLSGGSGI